jgi:hypothetical protein
VSTPELDSMTSNQVSHPHASAPRLPERSPRTCTCPSRSHVVDAADWTVSLRLLVNHGQCRTPPSCGRGCYM